MDAPLRFALRCCNFFFCLLRLTAVFAFTAAPEGPPDPCTSTAMLPAEDSPKTTLSSSNCKIRGGKRRNGGGTGCSVRKSTARGGRGAVYL